MDKGQDWKNPRPLGDQASGESLSLNLPTQTGSTTGLDNLETATAAGAGRSIMLSIPTGFQLRQFVHSGVLDLLLQRGFQVLIVSPNREGEGFTTQLPQQSVKICALHLKNPGRLAWRYSRARQHFLLPGPPTATLSWKMLALRRRYPWLALATQAGHSLLRLFPWLRRRVLRWERWLLKDKAIDALLADESVDLLLLGSPGYMRQDALLLHAAVGRGIPTVAAIMSWDNLSSKGFINPQPDLLLVWSDHMRHEAVDLQRLPAERIVETGAPHYDAFAHPDQYGSRRENFQNLGLDPERRFIFYGVNHAGDFPDEIAVVERVAQWVEEDALGIPCQLWVRLHPQAVTGAYKVSRERYDSLISERVKVEFPPIYDSSMEVDLPKGDLDHLIGLLRDADVVINTASTISIDAAILDRPVVGVAYDPSGDLPYKKSVRRYYDYTHMSNVVRAGAIQLATSPDDLRQKIVMYLQHPGLDREGRQRIVEQQFGRVDGKSAARLVDQVTALALKDRAKR